MSAYPLLPKIREILRLKNENVGWLSGQVDRSIRWLDGLKEINKINIADIERISEVLEFDFLTDYLTWKGTVLPQLSIVAEPKHSYSKAKGDEVTITINIRGNIKNAGKVLEKVKEATESEGFKID